jgi:ABC-type multidrug transport system fused ATPase/permease subunit
MAKQATEEEIIQAAKEANAWEFIEGFPEGLDTKVGDRGVFSSVVDSVSALPLPAPY